MIGSLSYNNHKNQRMLMFFDKNNNIVTTFGELVGDDYA